MNWPDSLDGGRRKARTTIDLRWVLVIRIVLVALLCVSGAALLALRNVATEAAEQNRAVAVSVEQQLATQLFRVETALDRADRFPDFQALANYALRPGQCIQFLRPDGTQQNSMCAGVDRHALHAPQWFVSGYSALFLEHAGAERRLTSRGQDKGIVKATVAPEAVAERAWNELSNMLGIWALMVVALCLLVYVVVHHALKPAADILVGINRLGDGDLTCRLQPYRLYELDRISQVLNELAQKLQSSTRERTELARQLVDAQERERAHIARELHDDVAQRLTALSAATRSIRNRVRSSIPQAAQECDDLVVMGSNTLRALRETLTLLRPPEIDELGLVASLQEMIDGLNRVAAGRTRIAFAQEGAFDRVSAETAAHTYRIVQEALNNVLRHANARHVQVMILSSSIGQAASQATIELKITDDGEGPSDGWTLAKGQRSGVGLAGMQERVFALGGEFHAGAGSSNGFEVRISFPAALTNAGHRLGEAA